MALNYHYHGFYIERRGQRWYGFCDHACKVIVRDKQWQCVKAMEDHCREHDAQLTLAIEPVAAWRPGDPFPF